MGARWYRKDRFYPYSYHLQCQWSFCFHLDNNLTIIICLCQQINLIMPETQVA